MAISDPDRYIFSELLEIEAVKLQYSEKIYQVRFNVNVIKFVSVRQTRGWGHSGKGCGFGVLLTIC